MEDILASIKRIIAEDGAAAAVAAPRARLQRGPRADAIPQPEREPVAVEEAVLELTEPMPEPSEPPEPRASSAAATSTSTPAPTPLVSDTTAQASRQSLAALSAMVVRPEPEAPPAGDNTLEGLVREMLRPMLKEWLDARLPDLVEGMVAREIARITGKPL